jgi:predicted nucleotidyltransferase
VEADLVRAKMPELLGTLTQLGVRSLSLFGSAARGDGKQGSDLDFLVEFEGAASFSRYMDLKELLEKEFQKPIDLVTLRALRRSLRDQVLAESIKVA